MKEWIELADGTKLEDSYVVKMGGEGIAVYTKAVRSLREAWVLFGDPEKTRRIVSDQYGDVNEWNGFTEPTAIQAGEDGAVICLRKGLMQIV